MKKSLLFLNAAVLALSTVFISACSDDDGGGGQAVIPPALIKTISFDNGEDVESWEFIYDDEDRVSSINVSWNGDPDGTREFNYSVAGELTITRNGNNGLLYYLDSEGRVIKYMGTDGNPDTWDSYEYNTDGILTKIYKHSGGASKLRFEMTVSNGNVTHRKEYNDEGTAITEDREFIYTTGDNASGIHQVYAVDSEWIWVGGLYGKQSKKLAHSFVRHITADPTSTYGVNFVYAFEGNKVSSVTKNGTSSGGAYVEVISYTYYEDEN